jgi:hypothetical protein
LFLGPVASVAGPLFWGAANERLLAVERRRQELQDYIATLTAQLKRAEGGKGQGK